MQKSIFRFAALAFVLTAILFSACNPDELPPIGTETDPPIITLVSEAGFLSGDATVAPGEQFFVKLEAKPGTDGDPLNTLTFYQDNVKIDLDRLDLDSGGNPLLLSGDNKTGITLELGITAHTEAGTSTYAFEVAADDAKTAEVVIAITVEGTPPTLTLSGDGMLNLAPGSLGAVSISAETGSGALKDIAVYENDVLISDLTRIRFNGSDFSENPMPIADTDQNGFTDAEVQIRASETIGTAVYLIEVTDEFGASATATLTIMSGTAVSLIEGILMNASGPAGQGGLNLITGEQTGTVSSDPTSENAHIRDEGIDLTLPAADNWKAQISGMNGSVIRTLSSLLPEGFKFDDVATVEEIVELFNTGDDLTDTNSDGDAVTAPVQSGDLFVVNNSDNYWLLSIREVNKTASGNDDNYVIDIKQ